MGPIKEVEQLTRIGRFGDALQVFLDSYRPKADIDADVLHACLLERTGNYKESRALCESVLTRPLSKSLRGVVETTMGIIRNDLGCEQVAIQHFQRACSLAQAAGDLSLLCWSQLRLMVTVADSSGPQAALPLLAQVRCNSQKLGDPHVAAALHVFFAEMEAKRGLFQSAIKHTSLGCRLLTREPNYWLEARAENVLVAVSIMRSDVAAGLDHGHRALRLSEASGSGSLRRACLGNLGNVHFLLGEFEKAVDYYNRAEHTLFSGGFSSNARLDSLAQIRIREGDLKSAEAYMTDIEASIVSDADWQLHPNRYAQLTKAELLLRQRRLSDALVACDIALSLSEKAADRLLKGGALLLKSHALLTANKISECLSILEQIDRDLLSCPELGAKYETVVARALAASGNDPGAEQHYERAHRIFAGLGNVPGNNEVVRLRNEERRANDSDGIQGSSSNGDIVQSIAALLSHVGRPELVAGEVVAILRDTHCVDYARALVREPSGVERTLLSFMSQSAGEAANSWEQVVTLGSVRDRTVEIRLRPSGGLESIATLTAVRRLLDTAFDLERAQVERQDQQTIWPILDPPTETGDTVISGKMSDLVAFAKRIATTSVGVLITGESGTGKEILARTIHRFSTRTEKPFIPFNCTAVPREMLESQLFGHRRGAFTGADRDNLGLIRAAKGGTLFLDEVGELSLDLQPKLLRFLESREIQPLGETSPVIVDVRVIAATNASLEEMVENGRFREDLYYRLNIIRLVIPPLRDRRDEIPALAHHFASGAAAEFKKGRVRLAEETIEHLVLYDWPGNIRQLQNEIRRIVALADDDSILRPSTLSAQVLRRVSGKTCQTGASLEMSIGLREKLTPTLWKIEREMIRVALSSHRGKVDDAARSLGISRKGLYLKRRRLGI